MTAAKWRRYSPAFVVALLVAVAYSFRYWPVPKVVSTLLRGGIYAGLYVAWGVSAGRRVIHPQSRRLFTVIAALMVFWMAARTVKFLLPSTAGAARYCWYLFYVGMLFIPLLAAEIAGSLGRPETYRLPAWTRRLYVAAGALLLLVLTNDLHRLVFVFPEGKPISDLDYSYGPGFIPVAVWRYGGLLATLGQVFVRSRLPRRGRRLLVPVIPAVLLVLYHILYLLGFPWLRAAFGDMTATECLLVVSILECCLRTGLIPCNYGYEELVRVCEVPLVIVDGENRQRIASGGYTPLPAESLRQAEEGPVLLENGLRFSSAPLQDGFVLWAEDISQLMEVTARLSDRSEYLTEQVLVRQREVEARRKEQILLERNRLYDRVIREMEGTIALFSELTDRLEACTDKDEEALLTAKLAIVCTQIKRSVNLVFIGESREKIDASELSYAIKEWLSSLRLAGVSCDCVFELDTLMGFSDMLALYDSLARILLTAIPALRSLLIRVQTREGAPLLLLGMECHKDLSKLEGPGVSVERDEDSEWLIELTLPEGGETA